LALAGSPTTTVIHRRNGSFRNWKSCYSRSEQHTCCA
jgi:hypothetical protein